MQRAWIIGNGPSLKEYHLEMLKDEVTFGVNRIHLLYSGIPDEWFLNRDEKKELNPNSIWTPKKPPRKLAPITYPYPVKNFVWMEWVGNDVMEWREAVAVHLQLGSALYMSAGHRGHYTNAHMRRFEVPKSRMEFYNLCQHGNNWLFPKDDPDLPTEWHLPLLCRYGGSLSAAIQIAAKEGYGPLYLIGCDLDFKDGQVNHFSETYAEGTDRMTPAFQGARTILAHQVALKSCPVPIINCTDGGKLDIYPRQDMEEVLYGIPSEPKPAKKRSRRRSEVKDAGLQP